MNTKSASTTLTSPSGIPCAEWCASHEPTGDICFTDDIVLNFDAPSPWMLRQVSVGLAAEIDGRVVVQIAVNGVGPEEMSAENAVRFGQALCAMTDMVFAFLCVHDVIATIDGRQVRCHIHQHHDDGTSGSPEYTVHENGAHYLEGFHRVTEAQLTEIPKGEKP